MIEELKLEQSTLMRQGTCMIWYSKRGRSRANFNSFLPQCFADDPESKAACTVNHQRHCIPTQTGRDRGLCRRGLGSSYLILAVPGSNHTSDP